MSNKSIKNNKSKKSKENKIKNNKIKKLNSADKKLRKRIEKDEKSLNDITENIREKGKGIYTNYSRICDESARYLSNSKTNLDWIRARNQIAKEIEDCTMEECLKIFATRQKTIISLDRNRDRNTFNTYYEEIDTGDAKKYIGFIISSHTLRNFKEDYKDVCWYRYFTEIEYEYLKKISLGDYIEISAYLSWLTSKGNSIENYLNALNNVIDIQWPCGNICTMDLSDNLKIFASEFDIYNKTLKEILQDKKPQTVNKNILANEISNNKDINIVEFFIAKCILKGIPTQNVKKDLNLSGKFSR
ncbi:MAG: hypothetical protein JXB88_22490 [Spirochaetales bacterium]|nr:hypothetical protein [Spirochaetales bacterium]